MEMMTRASQGWGEGWVRVCACVCVRVRTHTVFGTQDASRSYLLL